eukprot:6260978-Prymnesium_polylepis.1
MAGRVRWQHAPRAQWARRQRSRRPRCGSPCSTAECLARTCGVVGGSWACLFKGRERKNGVVSRDLGGEMTLMRWCWVIFARLSSRALGLRITWSAVWNLSSPSPFCV